jgi:hypothetical protein
MRKKLFTFIAVLVLSITLKPILITARQSEGQPSEGKTEQLPDQPQTKSKTAQGKTSKVDGGPQKSPVTVKEVAPIKTQEEPANEKQEGEDISAANWWMVRLTGLIGIIAILQLFVFKRQADRLKQTIEKMDEIAQGQTADMKKYIDQATRSASAMEQVAKDMAISAQAAKDSVAAVKERTAQQMRAYLTVLIGNAFFQDRAKNTRFQTTPILLNSGHTPAYKVDYNMRTAVLNISPHEFPPLHRKEPEESIIGPQQSCTLLDGGIVDDFVPDQDVGGIMYLTFGKALYVWGVVTYEDIFGEPHRTEFAQALCWLPDGKVFGVYTPGHNKAT